MANNAGFFGGPGPIQNTIAGENSARNVFSPPRPTFTGSLSPLAAQYQPPQAQDRFSAPSRPFFLNVPDTYTPIFYYNTQQLQHMQHTTNMQPQQLQELYNTSNPRTSSPYGGMYPPGSVFGAAQARGMPGQQQQQQQMMPPNFNTMPDGGASLTTQQRPMAQAYPPSARAQQLQSPLRTPSNVARPSNQHGGTPRMPVATTPSFEQRLAAQAGVSPYSGNIMTPPPSSHQSTNIPPQMQNSRSMAQQNGRRRAPAVQAPLTATPAQPTPSDVTNANMRGQKRSSSDAQQAFVRRTKARKVADANGNEVVEFINPTTGQPGRTTPQAFQNWFQYAQAQQAQKMANDAHEVQQVQNERARIAAENEKKAAADMKAQQEAWAKQQREQAEKARLERVERQRQEEQKRLQAAAAKAAKEQAERERIARVKEQQRLEQQRLEKQRLEKQHLEQHRILQAEKEKRDAAEKRAKAEEAHRQFVIAQDIRREKERKLLRKEQLRKDPSPLYRHYREYLSYFPVDSKDGERTNKYLFTLLANRSVPDNETEELALAVQYAKDNWQLYMEYPRDVKDAAKSQKEKLAKIKEDKQTATSTAAAARTSKR